MSPACSRNKRIPARTTAWSSARRTLICVEESFIDSLYLWIDRMPGPVWRVDAGKCLIQIGKAKPDDARAKKNPGQQTHPGIEGTQGITAIKGNRKGILGKSS